MSIIGKVLKTGIDVVPAPISVVADVVTLGGVLTDKNNSYTADHLSAVGEDLKDIYDEVSKL